VLQAALVRITSAISFSSKD